MGIKALAARLVLAVVLCVAGTVIAADVGVFISFQDPSMCLTVKEDSMRRLQMGKCSGHLSHRFDWSEVSKDPFPITSLGVSTRYSKLGTSWGEGQGIISTWEEERYSMKQWVIDNVGDSSFKICKKYHGDLCITWMDGFDSNDVRIKDSPTGNNQLWMIYKFGSCQNKANYYRYELDENYGKKRVRITCRPCPKGTALDAFGNTVEDCEKCQPGTFANAPGLHKCRKCGSGSFQDEEGMVGCKACEPGEFQDEDGQSLCKPCLPGSYSNGTRYKKSCTQCSPGWFQNDAGQTMCKPCPNNTYSAGDGATECTPCEDGWTSPDKSGECVRCPKGSYVDSKTGTCTKCPAGSKCPGGALTAHIPCPANKYSPRSGWDGCAPCAWKTYSAPGSTECLSTCPPFKRGNDCLTDVACLNVGGSVCREGTCSGPGPDVTGLCDECGPGRAGRICQHKVCRDSDLATNEVFLVSHESGPENFNWTVYGKPDRIGIQQVLEPGGKLQLEVKFVPVATEIKQYHTTVGDTTSLSKYSTANCQASTPSFTKFDNELADDNEASVGASYEVCVVGTWEKECVPKTWEYDGCSDKVRPRPQWCSNHVIAFHASVKVEIKDLSGTPVRDVTVELQVAEVVFKKTITSDSADVELLVEGLPAGQTSVDVKVLSVTPEKSGAEPNEYGLCPEVGECNEDNLETLESTRVVDFKQFDGDLAPTFVIVDKTSKTLEGMVEIPMDTGACPVGGVTVRAVDPSSGGLLVEAQTDSEGDFKMTVAVGTKIRLEAEYPGHNHTFAADSDSQTTESLFSVTGFTVTEHLRELKVIDNTEQSLNLYAAVTECGFPIAKNENEGKVTIKLEACRERSIELNMDMVETNATFLVPAASYALDLQFGGNDDDDDDGLTDALGAAFERKYPGALVMDLEDFDATLSFVYQPEPRMSMRVKGGHPLPLSCNEGERVPHFDWAVEAGLNIELVFDANQTHNDEVCFRMPEGTMVKVQSGLDITNTNPISNVNFVVPVNGSASEASMVRRVGRPGPRDSSGDPDDSGDSGDSGDLTRVVKYSVVNEGEWDSTKLMDEQTDVFLVLGQRASSGNEIVASIDTVDPLLYLYAPPSGSMPGSNAGAYARATISMTSSLTKHAKYTASIGQSSSLVAGLQVNQASNVNNLEFVTSLGTSTGTADSIEYYDRSENDITVTGLSVATERGAAGPGGDVVVIMGSVANVARGVDYKLNATTCGVDVRRTIVWGSNSPSVLIKTRNECKIERAIAQNTVKINEDQGNDCDAACKRDREKAQNAVDKWDGLLEHWEEDKRMALATPLPAKEIGINSEEQAQLTLGVSPVEIWTTKGTSVSAVVDYMSSMREEALTAELASLVQFGVDTEAGVGFMVKLVAMAGAFARVESSTSFFTEHTAEITTYDDQSNQTYAYFNDDTEGDTMSLAVHRSPHSGTYVFDVTGGSSSCPYLPGTEARHNLTVQLTGLPRRNPQDPDNVDAGVFEVTINRLESIAGDDSDMNVALWLDPSTQGLMDVQLAGKPLSGSSEGTVLGPFKDGNSFAYNFKYERLASGTPLKSITTIIYVAVQCGDDRDESRIWELPVELVWDADCPQIAFGGELEFLGDTWAITAANENFSVKPVTKGDTSGMDVTVSLYYKRAEVIAGEEWRLVQLGDDKPLRLNEETSLGLKDLDLRRGVNYHLQLRSVCSNEDDKGDKGAVPIGTSLSAPRLGIIDTQGPVLRSFDAVPRVLKPASLLPIAKLRFDEPLDCLHHELAATVTRHAANSSEVDSIKAVTYCSNGGVLLNVLVEIVNKAAAAAWSDAAINMTVSGIHDIHGNLGGTVLQPSSPAESKTRRKDDDEEDEANGELTGSFAMPSLAAWTDSEDDEPLVWPTPSVDEIEQMMREVREKVLPSRFIPLANFDDESPMESGSGLLSGDFFDSAFHPGPQEEDNQKGLTEPEAVAGWAVGAGAAGATVVLVAAAVAFRQRRRGERGNIGVSMVDAKLQAVSSSNPAFEA